VQDSSTPTPQTANKQLDLTIQSIFLQTPP